MAADKPITRFKWGDLVRVRSSAPTEWRPNEDADVCGLRTLDNDEHMAGMFVRRGSVIYLIEFGDGSAVEVPEEYVARPSPDE